MLIRNKTIGTDIRYFFAGVYWSPLSICSHMLRLSYAPALKSNGMPRTQWNMRYEAAIYVRFVKVHDVSCEMPGTISNMILRQNMRIG